MFEQLAIAIYLEYRLWRFEVNAFPVSRRMYAAMIGADPLVYPR